MKEILKEVLNQYIQPSAVLWNVILLLVGFLFWMVGNPGFLIGYAFGSIVGISVSIYLTKKRFERENHEGP